MDYVSHVSQISKSLLPSMVKKQTSEMANSPAATRWTQQAFMWPPRARDPQARLLHWCHPQHDLLPYFSSLRSVPFQTWRERHIQEASLSPPVGMHLCSVPPQPLELPPPGGSQLSALPLSAYWLVFCPTMGYALRGSRHGVTFCSCTTRCLQNAHYLRAKHGDTRNKSRLLYPSSYTSPVPVLCGAQQMLDACVPSFDTT